MQINQLPTIPQAPANADVFAIEVGGVTYKVSKSVLASAILAQLGGDPVTVAHGGTGATTAAAARTNLSVPSTSEMEDAIQQSTAYQESEDITLSGITASLKQIKRSGNTVVFSLRGTVNTEIPGYTNGRIVIPAAYRPRNSINLCVPYKIGSTVNIEQCQVMSDGNVRFGTVVPTGLLLVTFTYVV